MIVYFIRHSDTEWNKVKKLNGLTDIELSGVGIKHANKSSEVFSQIDFKNVYSSELKRTYETAKIITKNRYTIIKDNKNNERDYGLLEGKNISEVSSSEIELNSESHLCIYKRVLKFLRILEEKYTGDIKILVVAHLSILRHIDAYIRNTEYIVKDFNSLESFIAKFEGKKWSILDYC